MLSLKETDDVVVYIQSLLKENFTLPYYNISKLLKTYNYKVSEIIFIKPSKKQKRLTVHSIQETKKGINLTVFEESWSNYLPAIYRNEDLEAFIYGFQLSMFKYTEVIDNVEELFTPEHTPSEFVEWLASWYNIAFSNKIKLKNRRRIIYKLTELYNAKGTKYYLSEMVFLLTDIEIEIKEREVLDNFSMLNKNLSFVITIKKEPLYKDDSEKSLIHQIVKNIIENEKPIFTNALFDNSFIMNYIEPTLSTPIIEEKEVLYSKNNDTKEKDFKDKKKDSNSDYDDFF